MKFWIEIGVQFITAVAVTALLGLVMLDVVWTSHLP